jgi:hypothetical protein
MIQESTARTSHRAAVASRFARLHLRSAQEQQSQSTISPHGLSSPLVPLPHLSPKSAAQHLISLPARTFEKSCAGETRKEEAAAGPHASGRPAPRTHRGWPPPPPSTRGGCSRRYLEDADEAEHTSGKPPPTSASEAERAAAHVGGGRSQPRVRSRLPSLARGLGRHRASVGTLSPPS